MSMGYAADIICILHGRVPYLQQKVFMKLLMENMPCKTKNLKNQTTVLDKETGNIMLQINQCKISAETDGDEAVKKKISDLLHISDSEIKSYQILKRSLDARKKPFLFYVYSIAVEVSLSENTLLSKCIHNPNISKYKPPVDFKKQIPACRQVKNTVIIGAGPAGLFAAYTLVLAGDRPIIIERGERVDERIETVKKFWDEGVLDSHSNVSFGEGGAGTFSDGKLNTGNKDKTGCFRFILETFVRFGAPAEILYESKPHIGTDLLIQVIRNMRKEIERLGGIFHFNTIFTSPEIKDGKICGISCRNSKTGKESKFRCEYCILAIGHSADDTYFMLHKQKIRLEPKAFAVGVRVEHLQKMIDKSQYGSAELVLPAADYKVTARTKNGRSVYSFCMCPGGFVVNASSGERSLVINGMSNQCRSEKNANSAIVVSVTPEDYIGDSPLAGILFRNQIEKTAWADGKGKIPVQYYRDYKKNMPSVVLEGVTPNTKGDTILSNVRKLLPDFIGDAIEEAMPLFGKKIAGFDQDDTLILGVETRTSSPVRIVRDANFQSSLINLYPCGEGAGYAGGILSAAADGCKTAIQICIDEDK